MADNVAIAGSGSATAASDQVTHSGDAGVHVQLNRPVFVTGSEGSKTVVDWGNLGDAARVVAHRDQVRVSVTSGSLTTSVTAYVAGDQVGEMFDLTGMARANGGGGVITGIALLDEADIVGGYDCVLFRADITLAADNAAFAISDTDLLELVAIVPLAGAYDLTNNRVVQQYNLAVPYTCGSSTTTLYAALITRAGHTFFSAATNLKLVVHAERY